MNRIAGIALMVVGLIVLVLGITKVVPGSIQAGIVIFLTGVLVLGLSFIPKPQTAEGEGPSTASTLINAFVSPAEAFRSLRSHPKWLVAAIIMSLLSTTYLNLFMYRLTPERVTNYAIDKTLEMGMIRDNDQAKERVEAGRADAIAQAKDPVQRVLRVITAFCSSLFGFAFLAVVFLLFALAMGGQLNFWQGFSVAVYAMFPVTVIRSLLNTLVLFLKEPDDIHPILGQQTLIQDSLNFFVLPAEHPVLFAFLGAFSIFGIYWVWLNATGLKNAGEKVSSSIAWTASLCLYGLLVLFGITMAALFPSFIS